MSLRGFVDFGSTYTKVLIIDDADSTIVAKAQAPSTVSTDITIGLREAFARLEPNIAVEECMELNACSSAAGGLRMVACGLVPDLTSEAANRAALGAGAKVLGVYSYYLAKDDLADIARIKPDIILLAGGTDGGDKDVITYNASALSQLRLGVPIMLAGNRKAVDGIRDLFCEKGIESIVTENVMPEFGQINVVPVRGKIREIFEKNIVKAKGLDKAKEMVGSIIMPTPMAVLAAVQLLAEGTKEESGVGEVLVVDVGGATTDIHSAATGAPTDPTVILADSLPEPFAKRTVEGDLGIRINAPTIIDHVRKNKELVYLLEGWDKAWVDERVAFLSRRTEDIPIGYKEKQFDKLLAKAATEIAMQRHAGRLEIVYTPGGARLLQRGKDLTNVETIIGTGGIFALEKSQGYIMQGMLSKDSKDLRLKPRGGKFYVDQGYVMFAAGLLAEKDGTVALRLIKRYLEVVPEI